jgi:hypothetical protein
MVSSDTPVEGSSVSIEYDEIVGLSVACLSNIEASSIRRPTVDCILKTIGKYKLRKEKKDNIFGGIFLNFTRLYPIRTRCCSPSTAYSVWTDWFCIVFDRRR